MPHQCTGCGHTFEDGSKEMLSGCPNCGGNKFQFRPAGAEFDDTAASFPVDPEEPEGDIPKSDVSSVAETVGRATTKVRDLVTPDSPPNPDAEWPDEMDTAPDRSAQRERSRSHDTTTIHDPAVENESSIIDADERRTDANRTGAEDAAQASARSDVVSSPELSSTSHSSQTDDVATSHSPSSELDQTSRDADDRIVAESTDDGNAESTSNENTESTGNESTGPTDGGNAEPTDDGNSEPADDEEMGIAELREQLNDQFESIKILEPGQYELNLMELYDREEYIIALQENGRYVIQVPEQWIGNEPIEDE